MTGLKKESFHKSCLICNSSKVRPLKKYNKDYLGQCHSCGFVFSLRIPSLDELGEYYGGYVSGDYFSPITKKRYAEILERFAPYRKTNKILDIGCGEGYFLEVAKEKGWEVYGTEYAESVVQSCTEKGISMQKGILNANNYEPESFDVVTSFEVIEHINNPIEEIGNIKTLVRPGGLVYVTTPNFNSINRHLLKENYNVINYPEHLSYYTPRTIKDLFAKFGFSPVKIETTGFSLSRFKTSMKMSEEKFVGETSSDEKLRNSIESKPLLQTGKKVANRILTSIGIGDAMKATFVKK